MIVTALAAAGLMACTVTLPYLTGRVIDDVKARDRGSLGSILTIFVIVIVVRAGLAVLRRFLAGRLSLAVEYDMRDVVFARVQRLSFSYFDRMPVGQLMSRATSDLQAVRFFLGYGLIFIFMNIFSLILITAIMLRTNFSLALLALLTGPALILVAWRYSKRSNPILIDVQQKIGEVTQSAEESIAGIRVVKAFGREDARTGTFSGSARRAFDRSMDAARLESFYQPLMSFLPAVGFTIILLYGGFQTIDGVMTLGEFVAFYGYLLLLIGPFRSVGWLLGSAQRAVASEDVALHVEPSRLGRQRGEAVIPTFAIARRLNQVR